MKLQQLRYLNEVVRHHLNLSQAAEALFTSQPGVSKQIRLLEEELGITIFVRHGKRLTGVTEPGQAVLRYATRVLQEVDNLRQASREFTEEGSGSLVIATTHTQARYALPPAVKRFIERYPKVRLALHQGSPQQICEQVLDSSADLAIATESIDAYEQLVMLPCYAWNRCIITPPGHPLLGTSVLTLEALARYPIITYDFAFTGRSQINRAFALQGLVPNVVLTAIDADVIKTYVELGLGVGIVAQMAFDPARDTGLRSIDASHLFESSNTRIGIRRGKYLRAYTLDFIQMFAPHLTPEVTIAALQRETTAKPRP